MERTTHIRIVDGAGGERTAVEPRAPEELVGSLFSTTKELRHLAEQSLGQLFVPTEVLSADEHSADVVLRPEGMGEIVVHAERERHWYPYQITSIEANGTHGN